MILMLLLCSSLLNAQGDEELIKSKFLDEFYEFKLVNVKPVDGEEDTLYIQGPGLEYGPEDCYDFTITE